MKKYMDKRVICYEELHKYLDHWQKSYKNFEIVAILEPAVNTFDVVWSYEDD